MQKLLVLAAMEMETRAIVGALEGKFVSADSPIAIGGHPMPIEVRTIGIRAVRMPKAINKAEVGGIFMAGIAGALDRALKVGDVVIDAASDNLPKDLPFRVGKMHTATELITNPATRIFLHRTHEEIAVEMENEIVRTAARQAGVPYWGVRTISDTAEQTLDPRIIQLADELGRPKMGAVMKSMLYGPSFIGQMKTMGAQAKQAANSLGDAVKLLVGSWEKQLPR